MTSQQSEFKIGSYRPIYLWGGTGTIRMNRLKFMDQPVDEDAHHEVHSEQGAKRVLQDMYANWVHLMYDWGFPPETEGEDWEDFARAAKIYHQGGTKIFAYIQSSNCVYDGSYRDKNWYARDPNGERVFYYSGRYMACLTHPDWVQHLKDMILGAIERGADGIFYDNLWHGAMPISLFGAWLGAAGCFCKRCQAAYLEATGKPIPTVLEPNDPDTAHYLIYRADQVTQLVVELSAYANELQPGTPISANDFDIFMRSAYVVFGLDLAALAKAQDITMIENFALPRWDTRPKPRLANNALTIRNALSVVDDNAHLSILSYDVGIGFDSVYDGRRYQQGIAEAAACGASTTIKGTEYYYQGQHTVLTPSYFAPIHKAIGKYNRWLEANTHLYEGRQNAAPVGLIFPGERLWLHWQRLAPRYLGAAQALLYEGIPWRVVSNEADLEGLSTLLAFDSQSLEDLSLPAGLHVVFVPSLKGWRLDAPSIVSRTPGLRRTASRVTHGLMDAYFARKAARVLIDGIGMQRLFTQTPLFYVPQAQARTALLSALPGDIYPRVQADEPVLIDLWQQGEILQIHLMNYAASPQKVQVHFSTPISGRTASPDSPLIREIDGTKIETTVDIYTILTIKTDQ